MKLLTRYLSFLAILGAILLAQVALAGNSAKKALTEASEGPPSHLVEGQLNKTAYVKFKAFRLKRSQVFYVDRDALKQGGIEVPLDVYSPEFLRVINEEWGYGVPNDDDDPDLFGSKTKDFWTDRYGGRGTGALGSGRAAIAGLFQVKGFLTPLAQKFEDALKDEDGYKLGDENSLLGRIKNGFGQQLSAKVHTHGKLALRQAIIEQIWSSILDSELPVGSNRLPFILATGQHVVWQGPVQEPAALAVRLNPLRLAHYILSTVAKDPKAEQARVRVLFANLVDALPQPPGFASTDAGEKLESGVLWFATLLGRQFGTMYTLGDFHGSNSPSNIQLNGKALDLSSLTALDGFPQAIFVDDYPNGDLRVPQQDILEDFLASLKKTAPPELKKNLPTEKQVYATLEKSYQEQLDRDFLWLTGTPPELLDGVKDKPAAMVLTALLQKMAKAGNTARVDTMKKVPENGGTYDFEAVLTAVTDEDFNGSLKEAVRGNKERAALVEAYQNYVVELGRSAAKSKVSIKNLKEYLKLAAPLRNRKRTELFRGPDQWVKLAQLLVKYEVNHDSGPIRDFIDSTIQGNLRVFKDAPPFSVVLSSHATPETGNSIYEVFDARSGSNRVILNAEMSDEGANLFGRLVAAEDLEASRIFVSHEGKRVEHETLDYPEPDRVTIQLPEFDLKEGFTLRVQLADGRNLQFKNASGTAGIFRTRTIAGGEENCFARALEQTGIQSGLKKSTHALENGVDFLKGFNPFGH